MGARHHWPFHARRRLHGQRYRRCERGWQQSRHDYCWWHERGRREREIPSLFPLLGHPRAGCHFAHLQLTLSWRQMAPEVIQAYSPTHCYKHRSTFHSTNNTFITPTRHKPNTHSLFQNESDENQTVYSLFPPLNIIHEANSWLPTEPRI